MEVKLVRRIKEHGVEYRICTAYLINSESHGAAAGIDQIFPLREVPDDLHRCDAIERLQGEDFYRLAASQPIPIEKIESDFIFLIFEYFHIHGHRLLAGDWVASIKLAYVTDLFVPSTWGRSTFIFGGD